MRSETEGSCAESGLERLNRVSASMGFPGDDPRRGPFDEVQVKKASEYLGALDRWHALKGTDLLAVRLQYGRGVKRRHTARLFGISESVIGDRRLLAGRNKWIPNMSERDRRTLARLVWLGWLIRRPSVEHSADGLRALKSVSEWRRVEDDDLVWLPEDEHGDAAVMHTEIPYDGHHADQDPYGDGRADLWARFEDELDAIDAAEQRAIEQRAAGGRGEAISGDETADHEAVSGIGALFAPERGAEGMAAVGEQGAAAAQR